MYPAPKKWSFTFHHDHFTKPSLTVHYEAIEKVYSYKYLGLTLDHELTFQRNTEYIFSKCVAFSSGNSANFRFTNPSPLPSINVSLNLSSHL